MGQFKVGPRTELQTREWFAAHINDFEYSIIGSQAAFPDYLLEGPNGEEIAAEAEGLSENFIRHGHSPDQCDLVVCWRHTANLVVPVLELSTRKYHEAGEEAQEWEFSYPREKEKIDLSPYMGECEAEVQRFLVCFAEDLKARSQWLRFMEEPRGKLNSSAVALIQALIEAGASEELARVSEDGNPPIHPDILFSYLYQ